MKRFLKILKRCPLFTGIDDVDLEAVLSCTGARVHTFAKNETVLAEGERAKYVCVLISGAAQIERVDYYGNKSILTSIEPGELFGESFACAETEEIPVSAVATEESEVLFIECGRIIHTCANGCAFHDKMIFNLLKVMATKNILLNQKTEITAKRTTREKLMTYLLLQAKRQNRQSFTIPFDRQGLADFLGVDRSGLSAEISKLRAEGILECRKNQFKLL